MSTLRQLKHPPIVEALIHFQANASRVWASADVQELAKSLFPLHSKVEQQNQLSVQIEPSKTDLVPQVVQQLGHGFILRSATEPTAHQVKRDGYSYSRLKPYDGWETFVMAAKEGWNVFKKAFEPEELHSVALRFINRLDFPVNEFRENRDAFLTIAPRPPKGLNWNFGMFAQHYSLGTADSPCIVNLNLTRIIEAGQDSLSSMLLDIEVVLAQPLSALGLDIDDALALMRDAKNKAFFIA